MDEPPSVSMVALRVADVLVRSVTVGAEKVGVPKVLMVPSVV